MREPTIWDHIRWAFWAAVYKVYWVTFDVIEKLYYYTVDTWPNHSWRFLAGLRRKMILGPRKRGAK